MMKYRAIVEHPQSEWVEKGEQCHGSDLATVEQWAVEKAAQLPEGWHVAIYEVKVEEKGRWEPQRAREEVERRKKNA